MPESDMDMSVEVVSSLSPQAASTRVEVATRVRKSVMDRRIGARSFQENQREGGRRRRRRRFR
jgi:hypothetical protein